MKRIVGINALFAALLVACFFALGACNKSNSVPTLIWWQIGSRQQSFTEDQKVINEYVYSKIGVNVDFRIAGWDASGARFNTLVNTGEYFDILFVDGGSYARFQALGALADITDLVPSVAPELWRIVPSTLWDGARINNRIYAVPTYKDSSVTVFYFWDKYYVDKYDIDLTQTGWPFLDQTFRRIKAGEGPRMNPLVLARGYQNTYAFNYYDDLIAGFPPMGVRIDDTERRVVLTIEQPDFLEILRYHRAWFLDGIINQDANLLTETPKGRMFMQAQGWPSTAAIYAAQQGVETFLPVRAFGPLYSTSSIQGSMNAVSANSRYKEEALKLLQLVNTDTKLRDMLAYGIEGRHFEYVDVPGRGMAVRQLNPDWSLTNYQQGNFFIITPLENVPATYWDEVRQQNEEATASVMNGFMLDIASIQVDLSNLRVIWDKYQTDMLVGATDIEVILPRVINELRAAGLVRVMAEGQSQVDAHYLITK